MLIKHLHYFMFSAGDEGGVKIIKKTDNQLSFYVTDDEKAIVVQDIQEELKDTALSSKFLLCLLEDLTMMVEDNKEGFVELPDAGEGDNVEKQILDLDYLDQVLHRTRKNLMVLHMLSLLSEDKSIEENLMKHSDKMVQFVSLSIKRAAASIRSGENHSNLATQSLDMSLNILMVHLTRADLPTEDWVKMIEVMEYRTKRTRELVSSLLSSTDSLQLRRLSLMKLRISEKLRRKLRLTI